MFKFSRDFLDWDAYGNRGYVNNMLTTEFDALPTIESRKAGLPVDYSVVRESLPSNAWEWVSFANKTEGEHCAVVANWALHAAARQATTLDDIGRGVKDESFFNALPRKVTNTELALVVGQAVLGLATLHLLMGELYLKLSEIPRNATEEVPEFRASRRLHCIGFRSIVCKWPVFILGAIGLALLGLEMIALGVVWYAERKAANAVGEFVHMSLVGALARGTGSIPGNINEKGNVIVATVIAGTATYNSSHIVALRVTLVLTLLFGVTSFFVAYVPIRIWLNFREGEAARVNSMLEQNAPEIPSQPGGLV
jgi:phage shock protein PspC (stress-responsive transcriptional regulator)